MRNKGFELVVVIVILAVMVALKSCIADFKGLDGGLKAAI